MAAACTSRQRQIPFVLEVRDLWPAIFVELGVVRNRGLIRLLERWEMSIYRRATRIITVTDAFRSNLIERGVPERKVFTITNGADVDFWRPAEPPREMAQSLGLEGRFVVLYIGAHGISHALGRVLDCAKLLRSAPEIRFVFVGEGAEKEQLVRRARQEGLENVQFVEPVSKSDVKRFYALADVCLVPLRDVPLFEAFIPSKMFEMMAMARPIVASVRGEAADILYRSGAANVVQPEDSSAMADSILDLFRNRDRAREMGQRGRDFVVENYSRRSLAAAYMSVIDSAIDEYRKRRR
jgi:glycosyltransferase involved in cell wall biosynthesis